MTDTTTNYNAAEELLHATPAQEQPAFINEDGELSYAALRDKAERMGGLLARHALPAECRVAMIVHDTLDFPVIFLGAMRVAVVPIPLNTLLTTDQYRYILRDAGVKALFVASALLDTVRPALEGLDSLQAVFVCGGDGDHEYLSFSGELEESEPADAATTHRDSTAFWLYSSGSTGMPKGVRHVQTSMMDTATLYGQSVLRLMPGDVVYSAAKLFFAYGLGNGLSFPLSLGATTVLHAHRPTPQAVLANMKQFQPSVFFGAPTLFAAMLADDDCVPENASDRLRLCVSAGEALPEDIGLRWKERFGVDIVDGVGSTEMLHIYLSNTPDELNYGTSGRPVPGYKVRLVDENGSEVAENEIGELLVNGSSAAEGYWNQREKSRRTFAGQWVHTGDKYTRDARGIFTYSGRTDDMFKVSGQWVSPFEVESALISHSVVVEAAVVPAEDDDGLVKPKAYVVLQEQHESVDLFDELKAHVQEQVGKWKYPRWIVAVDQLPKTATGKIQRFKLRDLSTDQV